MSLILWIAVLAVAYAAPLVVPALGSYLETDPIEYWAVAFATAYLITAHSGLMTPSRPYLEAHPKEYKVWRRLNLATSCVAFMPLPFAIWPDLLPPLGPDFGFRPVHIFLAWLYGLAAGGVIIARYQLESRIRREAQQANMPS
jgi:hypothetical protein